MNNNKNYIRENKMLVLFTTVLMIVSLILGIRNNMMSAELNKKEQILNHTKEDLVNIKEDFKTEIANVNDLSQYIESIRQVLENTKQELEKTNNELNNTKNELDNTKKELNDTLNELEAANKNLNTHNGWRMCWREVNLEQWEIDFFAKLLYCEAGIMGYEGQFWVASAILNLSEITNMSIWEMGHKVNLFAVAPWVDNAQPKQKQYDIIYDVLNNGWIADVAFFRTDHYHTFGNPMTQIENVYFSKQ